MSETTNGVNVHLPQGYSGEPVEIIVRQGEAAAALDPKEPIAVELRGTLDAPLRWLEKRVSETEQINQKKCHILVNRDQLSIRLDIDENNQEGTVITGNLQIDPVFTEFGINTGKTWSPIKLGEFFKMNRAYFEDRSTNMNLVSLLKNFVAKVNSDIEKKLEQNGSKSEVFRMEVDSNLPEKFDIKIPVFKGSPRQTVEVETVAEISGQEVYLSLISPDAKEFIDNERDNQIDKILESIREIAPDIVIIEQ